MDVLNLLTPNIVLCSLVHTETSPKPTWITELQHRPSDIIHCHVRYCHVLEHSMHLHSIADTEGI